MAETYELITAKASSLPSYSFVGHNVDSIEYVENMICKLEEALKKYKAEKNKLWEYKTDAKLNYYRHKRYLLDKTRPKYLGRYTSWSAEREKFLLENYRTMKVSQLAKALGLSETSVRAKKHVLGLHAKRNEGQ